MDNRPREIHRKSSARFCCDKRSIIRFLECVAVPQVHLCLPHASTGDCKFGIHRVLTAPRCRCPSSRERVIRPHTLVSTVPTSQRGISVTGTRSTGRTSRDTCTWFSLRSWCGCLPRSTSSQGRWPTPSCTDWRSLSNLDAAGSGRSTY